MSSSSAFSSFSLAFSTLRKQSNTYITTSSTNLHLEKPENKAIIKAADSHKQELSIKKTPTQKESMSLFLGRREVISAAIGVSIAKSLFVQPEEYLALAGDGDGEGEGSTSSACDFTVSPSGLAFCDKLVGIGPQAAAGQLIKAHYVGKLENGKIFDSSYGRGKPLTFRVGVGEVIKGWDQGILGTDGVPPMLAGGKRTLKIPPELGYGMRGAGCRGGTCIIPPDSVLFFDVEFIGKA